MNIIQIGRILLSRWRIVLACVIVSVGVAVVFSGLATREYESTSVIYISSTDNGGDASSAYQGNLLSQQKVKSYVELFTSQRLLGEVINNLKLPTTVDDLRGRVSATSEPDTVLINVTVSDPSPDRSAQISNGLSSAFGSLVVDLDKPTVPGSSSGVSARLVQEALPPESASFPRWGLNVAVAGFVGLLLGVTSAMTASLLDTTYRTREELQDAVKRPVLGVTLKDEGMESDPIVVADKVPSRRSETFRQIRTNLQFIDLDNARKVLIVTSATEREGKSTTAANLAVSLRLAGVSVILVDADLRRPRVAEIFGLEQQVGLTSVVLGRISLDGAIQRTREGNLSVLTGGPIPPNPSELLGSQRMAGILGELRKRFEVVILDTPPLLPVTDAAVLSVFTDGAILVCRYGKTTRQQIQASIDSLSALSAKILGVIMSFVPPNIDESGNRYYSSYSDRSKAPNTGTRDDGSSNGYTPDSGGSDETRPVESRRAR